MTAFILSLFFTVQPVTNLEVVTFSGNVYIAGQGDDCLQAMRGAVLPEDWRSIRCIEVSMVQFD